jgi:hypothetical protein
MQSAFSSFLQARSHDLAIPVFSVISVLFGIPLDLEFAAANSYGYTQLRSSTEPLNLFPVDTLCDVVVS